MTRQIRRQLRREAKDTFFEELERADEFGWRPQAERYHDKLIDVACMLRIRGWVGDVTSHRTIWFWPPSDNGREPSEHLHCTALMFGYGDLAAAWAPYDFVGVDVGLVGEHIASPTLFLDDITPELLDAVESYRTGDPCPDIVHDLVAPRRLRRLLHAAAEAAGAAIDPYDLVVLEGQEELLEARYGSDTAADQTSTELERRRTYQHAVEKALLGDQPRSLFDVEILTHVDQVAAVGFMAEERGWSLFLSKMSVDGTSWVWEATMPEDAEDADGTVHIETGIDVDFDSLGFSVSLVGQPGHVTHPIPYSAITLDLLTVLEQYHEGDPVPEALPK